VLGVQLRIRKSCPGLPLTTRAVNPLLAFQLLKQRAESLSLHL